MQLLRKIALASLCVCAMAAAQAQTAAERYPARPVKLLLPLPAGSGIDVLARALAKEFADKTGQPLLVQNKPGANSVISTDLCAKSPPDGYTLCVITSSISLIPYLYKQLPFDAERDLKPVTQLIFAPEVVLMNPKLPVNNYRELVAYSKAHPGTLNYASFGVGGTPHLAFEWLKHEGGLDITHVPYAGSPPALLALQSGQIDLVYVSVGNPGILNMIESGKVKALLVPGDKRNPVLPGVPSFEEVGLPKFAVRTWHGVAAPAGTPDHIVTALADVFRGIMNSREFQDKVLKPMAVELVASRPDEFSRYLVQDRKNGAALVKLSGAKLE
ncbi:MAG: Bug family tripartite tricarboxylate transporter substrate binding protein [Burkholderiaceae bacterium]